MLPPPAVPTSSPGSRRTSRGRRLAAVLALAVLPAAARGAPAEPQHSVPALGRVVFPVSCSPAAQTEFERAVALLHHMTYPQAREAFERLAVLDPRCAMAHWGIAMTLFQPLWPTRPGPDALRRGWEAVETAQRLAPATELERRFVAAAGEFFRDPESPDYWLRIRRWEQAMESVHAAFPDDPEAAAFYALAHLAVAPTDHVSVEHSARAAELLLGVYRVNPQHPGAMHYIIHANDAPGRETELLDVVRAYQAVAPENPHALHMPTHIYVRLGEWADVVSGNLRAAEAALRHPAGERGEWVWDEFPHAIEYLVYAYLQQGADELAAAQLTRLRTTADLEPSFKTAFHLASTEARYALERRDWAAAAAIEPRRARGIDWDLFKWPEAVSWFARGLGAARLGDLDTARRAADRVAALAAAAAQGGEVLFARNIDVLELELRAWIAAGEGDTAAAAELLRRAAGIEEATPKHAVTPGPTLPAREQLGDLHLESGDADAARAAYEASLAHYAGRFRSLLGAARAARAAGATEAARDHYRALLGVAPAATRDEELAEARDFLGPAAESSGAVDTRRDTP